MTPDNDKTLRGIFRDVKIGWDEWNDRRDYRQQYEQTADIGQKDFFGNIDFIIPIDPYGRNKNVLYDRETPTIEEDEDYMYHISKFFPESKIVSAFHNMMSFGMARDLDGKFSYCDCCNRGLNALNCGGNHGMCDDCEDDHVKLMQSKKVFDIR